jgi:hypothetical protein
MLVVWTGLIWLRIDRYKWRALVNTVMNFRFPLTSGKLSRAYTIGGLSSGALREQFIAVALSTANPGPTDG